MLDFVAIPPCEFIRDASAVAAGGVRRSGTPNTLRGAGACYVDVGIAKRNPLDDRRRDVRAVGSLLYAMLAGDGRAHSWESDELSRPLRGFGVAPALAVTLAGGAALDSSQPPASARACGRALAPLASAAVRARWAADFAPLTARARAAQMMTRVPRGARRALGLLVVLALVMVGLWAVRDRIHLSTQPSGADRLLVAPHT